MTDSLIEQCFALEVINETELHLSIGKRTVALVFDPSMIDTNDLMKIKPGKVIFVRARRPAWGRGDLDRFIHTIEI